VKTTTETNSEGKKTTTEEYVIYSIVTRERDGETQKAQEKHQLQNIFARKNEVRKGTDSSYVRLKMSGLPRSL